MSIAPSTCACPHAHRSAPTTALLMALSTSQRCPRQLCSVSDISSSGSLRTPIGDRGKRGIGCESLLASLEILRRCRSTNFVMSCARWPQCYYRDRGRYNPFYSWNMPCLILLQLKMWLETSHTLIAPEWSQTLRSCDETPSWQQDNEFKPSGYRQSSISSVKRCFGSSNFVPSTVFLRRLYLLGSTSTLHIITNSSPKVRNVGLSAQNSVATWFLVYSIKSKAHT